MKKDNNDFFGKLLLCGVVILFVFLIDLIIYSIFDTINTKESDWISFWGSIFGGLLTLIGVAWTINDQNKKRKEDQKLRDKERREDKRLENQPHFNISFSPDIVKKEDLTIAIPLYENYTLLMLMGLGSYQIIDSNFLKIDFSMFNIGKGVAINFKIKEITLDGFILYYYDENVSQTFSIPNNHYCDFVLIYDLSHSPLFCRKWNAMNSSQASQIFITISYFDLLEDREYVETFYIKVNHFSFDKSRNIYYLSYADCALTKLPKEKKSNQNITSNKSKEG